MVLYEERGTLPEIRKKRQLTQQELSQQTGVPLPLIRRMEAGKLKKIAPGALLALGKALDIPAIAIIEKQEEGIKIIML